MSWEENKEFTESKPQYQPGPPLWKKTWKYIVVGVICFLIGFSISNGRAKYFAERNQALTAENHELKNTKKVQDSPAESTPVPVETASISPSKEDAAENAENNYEHNEYYDIVETSTIQNSGRYTTLVHKVLAKQDAYTSATLLAYDADGNVLDKSSDGIILTKGQYNFFKYVFNGDISTADIQTAVQSKKLSFADIQRKGVEMVKFNQTDDNLYITFKQNIEDFGTARYKLLFYKDEKIVDTEDGIFSLSLKNLTGKDTTDVAEISVYADYDRFEYIYQPSTSTN